MAVHIEASVRSDRADEGERIARDLAERSNVMIIGSDPNAAARVALAIAKHQARRRRVAVVDAVGELAPIEKLLPDGTAHGLVDMLQHGVSLGRVATPVDRAGNLFVIPSGAAPFDEEELFGSDRWPRLVRSFEEAGALLIVIAPEDSPSIARIVSLFDGCVLAGDAMAPAELPVLAHAREQDPAASAAQYPSRAKRRGVNPTRAPFLVAIAATVLAVAALAWWAVQSSLGTDAATSSVTSAGAVVGDRADGAPTRAAALVMDSSAVVPFGVALAQYNDVTAALTRIAQESARGIPAGTYAPFYDTNLRRQVFLVIAGAFHDRDDANSLLRSLRLQRILASGQGHVIDAPFAILVRSGLSAAEARSQLDSYRVKGMPAYSLVQPDGTVNIYAGAFRTTTDADAMRAELGADGAELRVVRRAGRPAQ